MTNAEFSAVVAAASPVVRPNAAGWLMPPPPRRTRPPTPEEAAAAESLVLGVDAVLSHAGGATFWGLDPFAGQAVPPECSVPMGRYRGNVLVHQRRRFEQLDVVIAGEIAVTGVIQTLADLGAVYPADVVERAMESAIRLGLVTDDELRTMVADFHAPWFRTGMRALRTVLDRRPRGAAATGSDAETVCLQHYRAEPSLPDPVRQFPVMRGDVLVATSDFGFPPVPFVTEVDGLAAHATQQALAYDLNRQNRIEDAEYGLRRFTALDAYFRPRYVCRETLAGLRLATLTWGRRLAIAS